MIMGIQTHIAIKYYAYFIITILLSLVITNLLKAHPQNVV